MRKKKSEGFFSGWTLFFIVSLGIFAFMFLVQQIMENTQDSSGNESNNSSFVGSSAESFKHEDKAIESGNKGTVADKKLSELTEKMAQADNLSDEEKMEIVQQKMAEGAQAVSKGDFQAALKTYNELVAFNPKDENAHKERGDVYKEMKNYNKAVEDYDEAIEINSDFAVAYCSRGASYLKLGNFDQAIADLNKAIELKPDYAEAYKNRAVYYRAMGDNASADSDLATANSLSAQ